MFPPAGSVYNVYESAWKYEISRNLIYHLVFLTFIMKQTTCQYSFPKLQVGWHFCFWIHTIPIKISRFFVHPSVFYPVYFSVSACVWTLISPLARVLASPYFFEYSFLIRKIVYTAVYTNYAVTRDGLDDRNLEIKLTFPAPILIFQF